jgi:hypothetical protein
MNIEILNWPDPQWEWDYGGVKSIRDDLIGVVVHICMETTQGKSLCSYLYFRIAKMS